MVLRSISRNGGTKSALDVQFAGDVYPRAGRWTTPEGASFDFPYHERQDVLRISTTFRLPLPVADLLEGAKPKNYAEMDAKIAGWQASSETSYSYHNFTGSRPDRLWLVIPFTLQKAGASSFAVEFAIDVAVNGRDAGDSLVQDANGNSFYVDITDRVHYGPNHDDNAVELTMRNLGRYEFMGPFLLYPAEALVGTALSEPGDTGRQIVYTRALIEPGPPRYVKGGPAPRIVDAYVTGNVTLTQPTKLRVCVDRQPAALQQVLYTHSGFPWMGMLPLEYDPVLACWVAEIKPGARAAIQESEHIYVWAIGGDGLYSEYYPVRVGWDFSD